MIEADKEIELRLEWRTICGLACQARVTGQSLNDLCEAVLTEKLVALHFEALLKDPSITLSEAVDWAESKGCRVNVDLTPRAESVGA